MWRVIFKKSASSYLFLAISIASMILFWQLGLAVLSGALDQTNSAVTSWVVAHRLPFLTPLVIALTNFGNGYIIALLVLLIFLLLIHRGASFKILLVYGSVQAAVSLSEYIKVVVSTSRPTVMILNTPGFAFPSGHATVATAFFLSALFVLWPELPTKRERQIVAAVAVLMIFLVSFSRIYLGVHWVSDVLGGMLLGLSVFCFAVYVYKKIALMHRFDARLKLKRAH